MAVGNTYAHSLKAKHGFPEILRNVAFEWFEELETYAAMLLGQPLDLEILSTDVEQIGKKLSDCPRIIALDAQIVLELMFVLHRYAPHGLLDRLVPERLANSLSELE